MKKKDVRVGHRYEVKVSGQMTIVRIDSYDESRGKFSGVNLVTERKVSGDFRRLGREVQQGTVLMDAVLANVRTRGDGSRVV